MPLHQFVAIDLGAVVNGVEQGRGLEGFPSLLFGVEGGVEQDEVGVQLRIQSAGSGVEEVVILKPFGVALLMQDAVYGGQTTSVGRGSRRAVAVRTTRPS